MNAHPENSAGSHAVTPPRAAASNPAIKPPVEPKRSAYAIEHVVANPDETPVTATDSRVDGEKPVSLWAGAWRQLRRKPTFIIAALLILLAVLVAAFPQLFWTEDPSKAQCLLENSNGKSAPGHPLGYTFQGCDVYSRVIAGTRASLIVGLFSTLGVVVLGGAIGALAGYFGGWLDFILSRLGDIFFALPLILGAIVMFQLPMFRDGRNAWTIVLILVVLGWPSVARIMRGAVVEVRGSDYVTSARSLGVSPLGILYKHVLPNALAPVIVIATISLGTFIVAESTLSYLGIGLPPTTASWGNDISDGRNSFRSNPWPVFWPGLALSLTVLSFIMLGDALRDALDPKSRKK
ncbi:ABC transporter permease [Falsarthrobacter nasiphocae]|uniref:Oligopeptide transport system permease protein n=1 Tax=Falsarthrobacter nasiphocae TaxID=189863 RepID=A0AAE3YG13_9MICC|nr:oligopeptide transport system permease protein [Falsarthrobacter nasiphocae]